MFDLNSCILPSLNNTPEVIMTLNLLIQAKYLLFHNLTHIVTEFFLSRLFTDFFLTLHLDIFKTHFYVLRGVHPL